jgi:hypothetical protein
MEHFHEAMISSGVAPGMGDTMHAWNCLEIVNEFRAAGAILIKGLK